MYKSVSKKLNTLILIVFVYISVKNILSFNDSDLEIVQEIDNYNSFLLENDFSDEELNNEKLNSEKNRFELVKKEENKKEDLNLAYYLDTEVATDIVIDEKNINLSLLNFDEFSFIQFSIRSNRSVSNSVTFLVFRSTYRDKTSFVAARYFFFL